MPKQNASIFSWPRRNERRLPSFVTTFMRPYSEHVPPERRRRTQWPGVLFLVVVAAVGLWAMIVPQYFDRIDQAKQAKASDDLTTLGKVLETYRDDVGHWPTRDLGLEALLEKPSTDKGWRGPYLSQKVPLDPWGNEYGYELFAAGSGMQIRVVCLGADAVPGGEGSSEDIEWRSDRETLSFGSK